MHNKIVVFGITKKASLEKLQSMLDNMRYGDVKSVKVSPNYDLQVELKDGTTLRNASSDYTSKGLIFSEAYIQHGVDMDIIKEIIKPRMFTPTEGNWQDWHGEQRIHMFK